MKQSELHKDLQALIGDWPDYLLRQLLNAPAHSEPPDEPQGDVVIDRPLVLQGTLYLPARVPLLGGSWARRGHRTAISVGEGFPENGPMILCLQPVRKKGASSNVNFNTTILGLNLECREVASGIVVRAAQCSTVSYNRIRNPMEYGLLIETGSRNLRLDSNDLDGGNMDEDAEANGGTASTSNATGMIFDGDQDSFGSGNNFWNLQEGLRLFGSRSVNLSNCYFERVGLPVAYAHSSRFCHINGNFEAIPTGCIARFDGKDIDGKKLAERPAAGLRVSGVISKTKNPFWIDRQGKRQEIPQSAWQKQEMEGNLGAGFDITDDGHTK